MLAELIAKEGAVSAKGKVPALAVRIAEMAARA